MNQNSKIGIIGCGWLGFALAKKLISENYQVKGSTTSIEKIEKFNKHNIEPCLLQINEDDIIGEISRTFALAVRLFGNIMSGSMIIGIMLIIAPFVFPVVMTALGLLTGLVQAYIFFILASVYIAAATSVDNTQTHFPPSIEQP